MSIDKLELGRKLKRLRDELEIEIGDVSSATGISADVLTKFENGEIEPSGDHILILADYYKCDYRFFISNERMTAIEQTEQLFRKHGNAFSLEDRWAILEFLYLCESEHWLQLELNRLTVGNFTPIITGTYYKGHRQLLKGLFEACYQEAK